MDRGFEVVSKYEGKGIKLPERATENAAGYDFAAAEDMTIPSIWQSGLMRTFGIIKAHAHIDEQDEIDSSKALKPYLIPTGIKAYMRPSEVLIIANRSSNPLKRGLVIPNGIGVIDADYYNNDSNEGEIFVQILNYGIKDRKIKKGDRIGQGIFMPYLVADNDGGTKQKRSGGFGSSGK